MSGGAPIPRQSFGRSLACAFSGLFEVLLHERNAQIEVCVALLVGAAVAYFRVSGWQLVAVLLCIFGILSFETMNSAIEALVDLASPQQHPLAKHAKDMAAGAVLMMALGSVIVGCVVFVPKIIWYAEAFGRQAPAPGTPSFNVSVLLVMLAFAFALWAFVMRAPHEKS
ncbi:MAG: diacylglycerol kinase family protein [Coriobacteriia bacterium]|nr:diacylglycerol kinase family protein [Coriobacteriia bacterium]